MRDCYVKYKKLQRSNAKTHNKYRRWPWINHLRFLDGTLAEREKQAIVAEVFKIENIDVIKTEPFEYVSENMPVSPVNMEPVLKKSKVNNVVEDSNEGSANLEYDDIDYLFLSYAKTLKQFSRKRQATVKMALANLFGQAELEEINEMGPTSPSTSSGAFTHYTSHSLNSIEQAILPECDDCDQKTGVHFLTKK